MMSMCSKCGRRWGRLPTGYFSSGQPCTYCSLAEAGTLPSPSLVTEQKPPVPSGGPDCWLLVLADMEERRKVGIVKYGQPVMPFNGRDPLVDAYQEALDLCVYLRQAIEERRASAATSNQEQTPGPSTLCDPEGPSGG